MFYLISFVSVELPANIQINKTIVTQRNDSHSKSMSIVFNKSCVSVSGNVHFFISVYTIC